MEETLKEFADLLVKPRISMTAKERAAQGKRRIFRTMVEKIGEQVVDSNWEVASEYSYKLASILESWSHQEKLVEDIEE